MSRRLSRGTPLMARTPMPADEPEVVAVAAAEPSATAVAGHKAQSGRRRSGGRRSLGGGRRRSFGTPSTPGIDRPKTLEEQAALKDMYSKVIQMSSENKITSKNAWSLKMIDHMESVLEDENDNANAHAGDNNERTPGGSKPKRANGGVNFQRASCTLDASVKIYSCRVDDTHQASYRILENLTRNGKSDDQGADKRVGEAKVGSKETSNKFCLANTLEKNPKALNVNSIDQHVHVDPFFHKMSQIFDEGGAHGMLLANLTLSTAQGAGCQVAFGDTAITDASATSASASASAPAPPPAVVPLGCGVSLDAMASLRGRIDTRISEMDGGASTPSTRDMPLCPQLAGLRHDLEKARNGELPGEGGEEDSDCEGEGEDAFPTDAFGAGGGDGDDVSDDGSNGGGGGWDDDGYDDEGEGDDVDLGDFDGFGDESTITGSTGSSPTSASEGAGVAGMGMGGAGVGAVGGGGGGGGGLQNMMVDSEYTFFDLDKLQANATGSNGWAGAAHWKFAQRRKQPSRAATKLAEGAEAEGEEGAEDAPTTRKTRGRKAAFKISFTSTPTAEDTQALQAALAPPPKKGRGKTAADPTLLAATSIKRFETAAAKGEYMLPEDIGIKTADLGRLFLRKSARRTPNGQGMGAAPQDACTMSGIGFEESHMLTFGSNANNANGAFNPMANGGADGDDDGYDNDDGGGYDGGFDDNSFDTSMAVGAGVGGAAGDDYDRSKMLAPVRRVEVIDVKHATRAKRVDVKDLKIQLWSELAATTAVDKAKSGKTDAGNAGGENEGENENEEENRSPVKEPVSANGGKAVGKASPDEGIVSFAQTMKNVDEGQHQSGVTLPFYFICVLHLANEKNLCLEGSDDLSDFFISQGAQGVIGPNAC